ncbi:hypothetical protein Pfo_006983 [Paulownia fortunei]|nr:hypothetical protein Pfo_006983 [Paulownia fortunei]
MHGSFISFSGFSSIAILTILNRLSAQRSRIKKAQYINDMEKMVKELEVLISVLTPQIESYKEKRKLLLLQNDSLQKLVEIRLNESKLCEIELEHKRVEVHRLQELEKSVNNNNHDSNFGPQLMQHLRFKQFMAPKFGFEQPDKDQQPGFMIKLPVEVLTPEKNQEEAEIDQYFNFEEALNVDPASASN